MKLPAWATAQIISLAAIGVLAWLWVGARNEVRAAKTDTARATTSLDLAEAGIQEVKRVSAKELEAARNLSQRRLADVLKAAGIKAAPVFVASGTTGRVTVGGNPLVGTSPTPGSARASGAGDLPSSSASAPALGPALVVPGDAMWANLDLSAAQTEAGNIAVDGQAEVWRGESGASSERPARLLLSRPLRLDVKVSPQVPGQSGAGWGVGAAAVLSPRGWALGPAVAAPPLRWWKFQLDTSAGVTLGSGGFWSGTATVIGRLQ